MHTRRVQGKGNKEKLATLKGETKISFLLSFQMSFLSMAGMVTHHKTCMGQANPGDFVSCSVCGMRFKQYKSMQNHKDKSHVEGGITATYEVVPVDGGGKVRRRGERTKGLSRSAHLTCLQILVKNVLEKGEHTGSVTTATAAAPISIQSPVPGTVEVPSPAYSLSDQAARIMAESRLISNPRPRGRPRKYPPTTAEATVRTVDEKKESPFLD